MEFSEVGMGKRFSHEGEFYKKSGEKSAVSEDSNEPCDFDAGADVFLLDGDDDEPEVD